MRIFYALLMVSRIQNLNFVGEYGLFKVNLEMAIFRFDLENEISVCVRNWELKTWILEPRFENNN